MKIETKYNIGDEVWIHLTSPQNVTITDIVVSNDKSLRYVVKSINRGFASFTTSVLERDVFPTKEELLKSL